MKARGAKCYLQRYLLGAKSTMTTTLSKPTTSPNVDVARGVIFGVKILGVRSDNNREYPLSVLRAAAPLYERVPVHLDHPQGAA